MKKLLVCAAVIALVGCAYHRTSEQTFNPDTKTYDTTTFTGIAWFNKQAVEGLEVGKRTKTTSTTLSVAKAATETQTEAIKAAAEGAAAGVLRTVKP